MVAEVVSMEAQAAVLPFGGGALAAALVSVAPGPTRRHGIRHRR